MTGAIRVVASRYSGRLGGPVRLGATLVALGVALAPGIAAAQSFTVADGQSVGPQVLTGAGDIGVIELGGEVVAAGTPGVELQASGQRVENAGSAGSSPRR